MAHTEVLFQILLVVLDASALMHNTLEILQGGVLRQRGQEVPARLTLVHWSTGSHCSGHSWAALKFPYAQATHKPASGKVH